MDCVKKKINNYGIFFSGSGDISRLCWGRFAIFPVQFIASSFHLLGKPLLDTKRSLGWFHGGKRCKFSLSSYSAIYKLVKITFPLLSVAEKNK